METDIQGYIINNSDVRIQYQDYNPTENMTEKGTTSNTGRIIGQTDYAILVHFNNIEYDNINTPYYMIPKADLIYIFDVQDEGGSDIEEQN